MFLTGSRQKSKKTITAKAAAGAGQVGQGKHLPAMRPARYTCVSKAGGAARRGRREKAKIFLTS